MGKDRRVVQIKIIDWMLLDFLNKQIFFLHYIIKKSVLQ